jgi:hypothetical protein
MAQRRAKDAMPGRNWLVTTIILFVVALLWWFMRRAEAPSPPSTEPGARVIAVPPAKEDLTKQDKDALDRVLRERGAPDQ